MRRPTRDTAAKDTAQSPHCHHLKKFSPIDLPRALQVHFSQFSWSSLLSWLFESVVQLTIELRPHLVLLGACYMAEREF